MCGYEVTFLPIHACTPSSLGCRPQTINNTTPHLLVDLNITSEVLE